MAAPRATASSGSMVLRGAIPVSVCTVCGSVTHACQKWSFWFLVLILGLDRRVLSSGLRVGGFKAERAETCGCVFFGASGSMVLRGTILVSVCTVCCFAVQQIVRIWWKCVGVRDEPWFECGAWCSVSGCFRDLGFGFWTAGCGLWVWGFGFWVWSFKL